MLHAVEVFLRHVAGWCLALLWWRPWRRRRPLLLTAKRVVVVRIDNRIGEVLLTTPLVHALAPTHEVHLVVHPKCVRVMDGLPDLAGLHAFERKWLWLGVFSSDVRRLRALCRHSVVVNAASWVEYSGTPALVSRLLGAQGCVVGPSRGPARALVDVSVMPRTDTRHEVEQRLHLLSPLVTSPHGEMCFRTPRSTTSVETLISAHPSFAVVNPGGRLDSRRVPTDVFAGVTKALVERGITPIVTWGPGEEALANEVLRGGSGVLAPKTSLDELAALMAKSKVVICNNTGPMHLSVAVGAKTVALFWRMPVDQWGHLKSPHSMLDLTNESSVDSMVARVAQVL
jgi:heptosyltransferase III